MPKAINIQTLEYTTRPRKIWPLRLKSSIFKQQISQLQCLLFGLSKLPRPATSHLLKLVESLNSLRSTV